MFRVLLSRELASKLRFAPVIRNKSAAASAAPPLAKAPEKIEVFVDDIPVMVEPGTTVLQVYIKLNILFLFVIYIK